MDRLSGVKIVKAESKKTGSGQYGSWELFRISIDDADWKDQHFSYFADAKHPALKVGQEVDFIEFETTQDGQYTNYTIKKVGLKETDKPKPQPQGSSGGGGSAGPRDNNPISMYFGYGRTLTETMMDILPPLEAKKFRNPELVAAFVVYFAHTLHKASTGDPKTMSRMRDVFMAEVGTSTKQGSPDTDDPQPPGEDDPETFDPQKWAAEEALHCAEIDNLPHLENWWKKICPSSERKKAEKVGHWKGLSDAYTERKVQLKNEYAAAKDAEGKAVNDEEIPF